MPPSTKPAACGGCPLETRGYGFARPAGPIGAPVAIYGEALGQWESWENEAFVGPAGATLNRVIRQAGFDRADFRIHNVVNCRPVRDWLEGAPWERGAVQHCGSRYVDPAIEEWLRAGGKVVLALGGVAIRRFLDLPRGGGMKVKDFHGTVSRSPCGRFWVVGAHHPSYVRDKEPSLFPVLKHDLELAVQVAKEGWQPDVPRLIIDPPLDWFERWCDNYLTNRHSCWLAVDTETPEKEAADEDELMGEKGSTMTRINFSCSTGEGITVQPRGEYRKHIARILAADGTKAFWFAQFDLDVIRKDGFEVGGVVHDVMWIWHVVQSDLPMSLGFVAPFYSKMGPWKHWTSTDFGAYAAGDAVQTLRIAYGVAQDAVDLGLWEVYERHIWLVDQLALRPAEAIGLGYDRRRAERIGAAIGRMEKRLEGEVRQLASGTRLHPRGGWKTRPKNELIEVKEKRKKGHEVHKFTQADVIEQVEKVEVLICQSCEPPKVVATEKHQKCRKQKPPKVPKVKVPKPKKEAGSPRRKRSPAPASPGPKSPSSSPTSSGEPTEGETSSPTSAPSDPRTGLLERS